MRCGKCKAEGVDVDHVKQCYGIEPDDGVRVGPRNPASPEMKKYVFDLQDERVLPEQWTLYTDESLSLMERVEVHGVINALKVLPRKSTGSNAWTMPEGRYALQDVDDWLFYQVDKPDKGRWAGYVFVKRLIGAPGHYKQFNVRNAAERNDILRKIEDDPKQAMVDYGLQSSECGRCHSPLTVKESRERGLGPVCAGKMGW